MCQHLSFLRVRQAAGIEPRSEPDSRNPTVRDRRGAYGNVGHGSRTEARRETDGLATEPYSRARHRSIPTTRESLISFLSQQGADQHGGDPSGESGSVGGLVEQSLSLPGQPTGHAAGSMVIQVSHRVPGG